jgi:hypothetical protein
MRPAVPENISTLLRGTPRSNRADQADRIRSERSVPAAAITHIRPLIINNQGLDDHRRQ